MASEMEGRQPKNPEANSHPEGFFTHEEIKIIARIASSRTPSEYVINCRMVRDSIRQKFENKTTTSSPFFIQSIRDDILASPILQSLIASEVFGGMINYNPHFVGAKQAQIRILILQLFPLSSFKIIGEVEKIWKENQT